MGEGAPSRFTVESVFQITPIPITYLETLTSLKNQATVPHGSLTQGLQSPPQG